MTSTGTTKDTKALSILLEMLQYVERELRLLDSPVSDAASSVKQAATKVEGALRARFALSEQI